MGVVGFLNLGLRRKLQGEGQGRRLAAVHAAFIWRGKRHAEQRRPRRCHGIGLGHAVWLSEDCAVAIVSVVRTGHKRGLLGV